MSNFVAQRLAQLAKDILQLPTLEKCGHPAIDYPEIPLWQLRWALTAAYQAGQQDSGKPITNRRRMDISFRRAINRIEQIIDIAIPFPRNCGPTTSVKISIEDLYDILKIMYNTGAGRLS